MWLLPYFRWSQLILVFFVAGCTSIGRSSFIELPVAQSQAGPITIEVGGAANGITDAYLTKMIKEGVQQGCNNGASDKTKMAAGPNLSMFWTFQPTGNRPLVMVSASLFSDRHKVGLTFGRILSPSAEPTASFEYAIANITCTLYNKARYLTES